MAQLGDRLTLHLLLGRAIQPHHPLDLPGREGMLPQVEVPEQKALLLGENREQLGQQGPLFVAAIGRTGEAGGDAVREVGLGDRPVVGPDIWGMTTRDLLQDRVA